MKTLRILVRATIGVTFPILAFAQSGPQQARPDPTDAIASVPLLHYESALENYRPMDEKAAPAKEWRSANDLVRDTGSMSGMSMGEESGAMQGMDMKKPKSESSKPAQPKTPAPQDSMPGMDMSSGNHTKHGKETP